MRRVVIFTNRRAGSGRTTLTRGARDSARRERNVGPPYRFGSSGEPHEEPSGCGRAGLYELFEGDPPAIQKLRPTLSLIAGDSRLAALEKRYLGEVDAYEKLRGIIDSLSPYNYGLILVDSPPSLSIMTLNGLAAATHFVIPLRPALYSLQGTNDLLASVAKVKKSLNPGA